MASPLTTNPDTITVSFNNLESKLRQGISLDGNDIQVLLKDPNSIVYKSVAGYVTYVNSKELMNQIQQNQLALQQMLRDQELMIAVEKSRATTKGVDDNESLDHLKSATQLTKDLQHTQKLLDELKAQHDKLENLMARHKTLVEKTIPQQWQALRQQLVTTHYVPVLNDVLKKHGAPELTASDVDYIAGKRSVAEAVLVKPEMFKEAGIPAEHINQENVIKRDALNRDFRILLAMANKLKNKESLDDLEEIESATDVLKNNSLRNDTIAATKDANQITTEKSTELFEQHQQAKAQIGNEAMATINKAQQLFTQIKQQQQRTVANIDRMQQQSKPVFVFQSDANAIMREVQFSMMRPTYASANPQQLGREMGVQQQRVQQATPTTTSPRPQPTAQTPRFDAISYQQSFGTHYKKMKEEEQQKLQTEMENTKQRLDQQPGWMNDQSQGTQQFLAMYSLLKEFELNAAAQKQHGNTHMHSPFSTQLKPPGFKSGV